MSLSTADSHTNPDEYADRTIHGTAGSLAGTIGHEKFPGGDRAALRRMQPGKEPPSAFWRLLMEKVPEPFRRGNEQEDHWAALMQAMAIMAPGGHNPGSRLGRVLARLDQGSMESRLMKFLASRGGAMHDQLRLLARMLAARGSQVDFGQIAGLLLYSEGEEREKVRRDMARDFFGQQYKNMSDKEQTSENGGGE